LIEEVFSNSNFTNNVNSGNLGEVISIIANEIEESRLMQTDLLGDAIESALSETGGTKDIGLFRTPDHIRQFMTALVEPTIDDVIFDPACGTGGFLFDAYEFVMRRIDPDREWPGEKAHTELSAWFDDYFKANQTNFPSIEQTTQFYRGGVAGIEYLGMIRKMAAINFYVRGLNPANIEQGDSLAKYNPVTDHESKSAVLANPPFGAQRDQDSYPEVWSEYSKESETTILFVKLMFELLKQGGRCAVVVSEGFHTWDQFSAKALRKMLLDEAQLKALISLPQGLFVSKSGQGPKTSILIFEKGGQTDWTWFYKATNDGYSIGTNRKEQKGNQLVECLKLYHGFVKHGNKPPETKNQFCIPAEWIKTLDPRIKEKIRTETRADMEAKGLIERKKKETDLNKKIADKKLTGEEREMDLKVFDQMLENRIQNEIAKRIEKAHNYSFNLANYKSTISDSQITEWTDALKHIQANGATTLENIYKKLNSSRPENILPYLLKLNPANALEADIAREYVSNMNNELITKHKELNLIKEILKSGAKYPFVSIKETCDYGKGKFPSQATPEGVFPFVLTAKDRKSAPEYQLDTKAVCIPLISSTGHGSATLNRLHYQEGKFALANLLFAAIPKNPETELYPKFLYYILDARREELFCPLMKGTANVGMRMDDALNVRFPLPDIEIQKQLVAQIDKQKAIIEGVEKILMNWHVSYSTENCLQKSLGEVIELQRGHDLPISQFINGEYPVVGSNGIIGFHDEFKYRSPGVVTGRSGTIGKVHFLEKDYWPHNTSLFVKDFKGNEPKFIFYLLQTIDLKGLAENNTAVPSLDRKNAYKIILQFPKDLETQHQIIAELDAKMQIMQGLSRLKIEAEKKIDQAMAEVWGIEFVEPVNLEVEDE